jgi:hypothetical protein
MAGSSSCSFNKLPQEPPSSSCWTRVSLYPQPTSATQQLSSGCAMTCRMCLTWSCQQSEVLKMSRAEPCIRYATRPETVTLSTTGSDYYCLHDFSCHNSSPVCQQLQVCLLAGPSLATSSAVVRGERGLCCSAVECQPAASMHITAAANAGVQVSGPVVPGKEEKQGSDESRHLCPSTLKSTALWIPGALRPPHFCPPSPTSPCW